MIKKTRTCINCKLSPVESLTHKRRINPSRDLCADCSSLNEALHDPEKCKEAFYKHEAVMDKKKDILSIIDMLRRPGEICAQTDKDEPVDRRECYRKIAAINRARLKKILTKFTKDQISCAKDLILKCPKDHFTAHAFFDSSLAEIIYLQDDKYLRKKIPISLMNKYVEEGALSVPYVECKIKTGPSQAYRIIKELESIL